MFLRTTGRYLLYGTLLALGNNAWQSCNRFLQVPLGGISEEMSADHERESDHQEAFERFRQHASDFWMREYEAELEAAGERVGREMGVALGIAAQVNATAQRQAATTAQWQVGQHLEKATRIATRNASSEQDAIAELALRQARADRAAAEQIASRQAEADRRATEIIVQREAERNRKLVELITGRAAGANRPVGSDHRDRVRGQSLNSPGVPSSSDGVHVPAP